MSRGWHRLALYFGLAEPDAQDRAEAADHRPAPLSRKAILFGAGIEVGFLVLGLLDRRRSHA